MTLEELHGPRHAALRVTPNAQMDRIGHALQFAAFPPPTCKPLGQARFDSFVYSL